MRMDFNSSGQLSFTDYWTCDHGALAGRAWLRVRGGVWHVLLPQVPSRRSVRQAVALPVTARRETAGWQWALISQAGLNARISLECVIDQAPRLPVVGALMDRRLIVYDHWLPHLTEVKHNFGHFTAGEIPIVINCELQVVRVPRGRNAILQWVWDNRSK